MLQYNFYELNGFALIEMMQSVPYVDFSTRERKLNAGVKSNGYYYRILKGVEAHDDNALFYQVKKHLTETSEDCNDSVWNEYSLQQRIVYIDFSNVFPIEKRFCTRKFGKDYTNENKRDALKQVREFFYNGFKIKFSEKEPPVLFIPFERSASMVRQGTMLFIDKRFYIPVEERLRLGLSFTRNGRENNYAPKVSASKFYAYTGLYLSGGKRIRETEEFKLNEETVIVLADNVIDNREPEKVEGGVITAIGEAIKVTSDGTIVENISNTGATLYDKWEIGVRDKVLLKRNFFDGEGIISPSYMERINKELQEHYGVNGTAASVQVRMPFTKGMLHQVDFHAFICEVLGIKSCDGVYIEDVYGNKRDLGKAEIILTHSMFKIKNWLENEKISSYDKNKEDLIKLYFNRFHFYEHALYIGNTDISMARDPKIKLNYQFLNTLALTYEEQESLVKEHIDYIGKSCFKCRKSDGKYVEVDDSDDENYDENSYSEARNTGEAWSEVLRVNPAFIREKKVQGMINGKEYQLLKDIGRGRLMVCGANRFLSRDLVPFLRYMISRIDTDKSGIKKDNIGNAYDLLTKNMLRTTSFFVADAVPENVYFKDLCGKLRLDSRLYYGILRNPHLSRCEQSSLRAFIPKKDDLYSRYFSHLKGIIMVPYKSDIPQTLGGADFDGDIVKIITDIRINSAINAGCYEWDTEKKKLNRKLPIIIIPSTSPKPIVLEDDHVDFRTLQDTFSTRIGMISNAAIALGKREYDNNRKNNDYDLKCESCTILTGLEIDSVKTGSHPYLEDILNKAEGIDDFIKQIDKIDKLPKWHQLLVLKDIYEVISDKDKTKKQVVTLSAIMKYGDKPGKVLLKADNQYDTWLDMLPFIFLEELKENIDKKRVANNHYCREDKCFQFEVSTDCADSADAEKEQKLQELISAYKKILQISKEVYKTQERVTASNYAGCIYTIMRLQYYDRYKVQSLQETVFRELLKNIESYSKAERILEQLVKNEMWPFLEKKADKIDYIYGLLRCEKMGKEVENALTNYSCNGFFLLYYYIKDIMVYYREALTGFQIEGEENKKSRNNCNNKAYDVFRDIYTQALSERESKKIWKTKIIAYCRHELETIFDNNVQDAIKYSYGLRSIDSNGDFLWDVFTAKEILGKSKVFRDNGKEA